MKKNNEKQAQALQMVEIDHSKFAVEIQNGNASVNLTQMAKMFGKYKRPDVWLRTQESKDYIAALGVSLKSGTADLLTVKQGGVNQGTWAHDYRIAMRFAQWLDPYFSVAVDDLLLKLLTHQAVVAEPINGVWPLVQNGIVGYPKKEIWESAGYHSNSGNIKSVKKKFGAEQFFVMYRTLCVTPKMARLIAKRGEVRQLELDFSKGGAL